MTATIVKAAIHPGIGIARIGDSDDYVLSPRVMSPKPRAAGSYHDANGALKREGAEFRIYGYDAQGNVVAELTDANADIAWNVHLAASKAQWYAFRAAMDLSASKNFQMRLRNTQYDPDKRGDLNIDAGIVHAVGAGADHQCSGTFTYKETSAEVLIGEVKTDAEGRLIVLSGKGASGSPAGMPLDSNREPDWFGNATGWYDDAADGPVNATVKIGGQVIPCEGAWAVCAPPNYAPNVIGWRTMDDLMQDMFAQNGMITLPQEVSFSRDIYPLLQRMTGLQWVNKGFAAMFGAGGPLNFDDPQAIDRICRIHGSDDTYQELRRGFYNAFRQIGQLAPQAWPNIYGDEFGTFPVDFPQNHLPIWTAANDRLQKWVSGAFVADWGQVHAPADLADVPLSDQPTMLDRAAMHFCLADAFHPGCEMTWPMRHISMYSGPYRLKQRAPGTPAPDYGPVLTQEIALGAGGPLHDQGPGDLTRWMALPWQMDTAGCRSGYEVPGMAYDPYLPTFWPARVPNTVLTRADYDKVMDTSLTDEERRSAFAARRSWYYPLGGSGEMEEMELMVKRFARMGVIEAMPGPTDGAVPELPTTIYVETLPHLADELVALAQEHGAAMGLLRSTPADAQAQKAGWRDDAHRKFYANARFPGRGDLQ